MKTKTVKVPLETPDHILSFGGYSSDSQIFKQSDSEFINDCGGRLAIALFKGEFKNELYSIIRWAEARGMKYYHDRLLKE